GGGCGARRSNVGSAAGSGRQATSVASNGAVWQGSSTPSVEGGEGLQRRNPARPLSARLEPRQVAGSGVMGLSVWNGRTFAVKTATSTTLVTGGGGGGGRAGGTAADAGVAGAFGAMPGSGGGGVGSDAALNQSPARSLARAWKRAPTIRR